MNKLFIFSISLISLILLGFVLYPPLIPFSPLIQILTPPNLTTNVPKPYKIIGFLPYWNLKKTSSQAIDTCTEVAYFALRLNGDGTLMTHVNRREQEPGFTNYQRILKNNSLPQSKLLLTFVQKDQDSLVSLLQSASNRKRAIATIINLVKESQSSGINIDFEPLGDSLALSPYFTRFMQELKSAISQSGLSPFHLSVSLYPSSASRPRMWNVPELNPILDYFIIMSYDYTMPGSTKAGPNSPLRGAGQLFEHDILTNLAEFTAYVPSEKLLLGIPFYGYEWDTDEATKYTNVSGRGAMASLERIQKLVDENTLELLWDRNSLTPYALRKEDGKVVSQIYFEDINSIKLKLDLVKQANLGGIAIWALGYEGHNPDLWNTLKHRLLLVL